MIEAGILDEDDRVELLEGLVVPKMAHKPPHDCTVDLAREIIDSRLPKGWRVRVQSAITTADSQPEPDLAIVPGPASRYFDHHPTPQVIALLIEVADTSLARDRQEKARLYARASVRCYWIINLLDRQIEIYTDPSGPDASPTYRERSDFILGTTVTFPMEGHEAQEIPVADFFPR